MTSAQGLPEVTVGFLQTRSAASAHEGLALLNLVGLAERTPADREVPLAILYHQ